MKVDFESMQMTKPRMAKVRRSFEDGVWLQYRQSPHSTQLHAKINKVQVRMCVCVSVMYGLALRT